jgi:hypothetical protein
MMAKSYWEKRHWMLYYRYLEMVVRGVASDCKSMIDVGAYNIPVIEKFGWVEDRVALDLQNPYNSPRVRGIEADFFAYKPEKRFDIALCCQVLEHIPDAGTFAKRLFEVGKRVLITVPYMWPENSSKNHIHDPVDLEKLARWTGREPAYSIVVEEPFTPGPKARRLIAYYSGPGETFSPGAARQVLIDMPLPLSQRKKKKWKAKAT